MNKVSLVIAMSVLPLTAMADVQANVAKCAGPAEQYVTTGYSQPAYFAGVNGNQITYHVLTNQQGGDAAYEVIVDGRNCQLLSKRVLWSE